VAGPLIHLWAGILKLTCGVKAYDSHRVNTSHGGKALIACFRINPKFILIEEFFNRKDQSFGFLEWTSK